MSRKQWFFIVITTLVLASLACNMGSSAGSKPTSKPAEVNEPTQGEQAADAENDEVLIPEPTHTPLSTNTPAPTDTPVPTETPVPTLTPVPSNPIGIWQGLSSLNSYRLTIRMVSNGPTTFDKNVITSQVEQGSDGESSHTHSETLSSSAEYPEEGTSISDEYQVGDRTCSFSSGSDEVEKGDVDPYLKEMQGTWPMMVDLVPMVQDPVFVGEEQLNGVMTNHFTFTIGGLGVDSGAEVVASGGEYWLAQDGQYVVKYSIVLETRSGPEDDPNTETLHAEFFIEVQDINQEIVISMPAVCQ